MKSTITGNPLTRTGIKNEVRPSFFIVGAARSGTTSLYCWLKQHPDVFLPEEKEPSYFCHTYGIRDWAKYLSLFEAGKNKTAIGEASTSYLTSPESAEWIRKELSNVRIIILLRNPLERAFSLYNWMVMHGYEWLPTFEIAIQEEDNRFSDLCFRKENPQYFWNYMYYRSGLYCTQVKRYLDVFGRDAVRIFFFEDLRARPHQVYEEVCELLAISTEFVPSFAPQNPSHAPRYINLQYRFRNMHRSSKLPRLFRRRVRNIVSSAMRLNVALGTQRPFPAKMRETLEKLYQEDILQLSAIARRDLSHWLSTV
jgi:hypothetical protein